MTKKWIGAWVGEDVWVFVLFVVVFACFFPPKYINSLDRRLQIFLEV